MARRLIPVGHRLLAPSRAAPYAAYLRIAAHTFEYEDAKAH